MNTYMRLKSPLHVHWEITNQCNYDCIHCYQQSEKRLEPLNENSLYLIAEQLVDAEIFQVSISGGEPFLINNLPQIVTLFCDNNIELVICTNGSNLRKECLEVIRDNNVSIQLSVDAADEIRNDEIRGYTGAYRNTCNAISILSSLNIPLSLSFCATSQNFRDITAIARMCNDLQIERLVVGEIVPTIFTDDNKRKLLLGCEDYAELGVLIESAREDNPSIIVDVNSEWGFLYNSIFEHSPCTALERDCAILHDGSVLPCPFVRNKEYSLGNILTSALTDIWKEAENSEFYKHKHEGCDESCIFYGNCLSGCKAELANNNLNLRERDPRCPMRK